MTLKDDIEFQWALTAIINQTVKVHGPLVNTAAPDQTVTSLLEHGCSNRIKANNRLRPPSLGASDLPQFVNQVPIAPPGMEADSTR